MALKVIMKDGSFQTIQSDVWKPEDLWEQINHKKNMYDSYTMHLPGAKFNVDDVEDIEEL